MSYRILIMGLPGSGKTTLAGELIKKFEGWWWVNGDKLRQSYNDWDFSEEGRLRQAKRMRQYADDAPSDAVVIADFVAPLPEMRRIYDADYTIWMDTIDEGRFEDTNKMFVPPSSFDLRIDTKQAEYWSDIIVHIITEIRQPEIKMGKDRFDFEQEIMQCWNIVEELKVLHEGVFERDLTRDQISNILLGLAEIYQLRFEILFDTFEQMVSKREI